MVRSASAIGAILLTLFLLSSLSNPYHYIVGYVAGGEQTNFDGGTAVMFVNGKEYRSLLNQHGHFDFRCRCRDSEARFTITISGKIHLYEYDIGNDKVTQLRLEL